jgi:hypothetical protein
VENIFTYKICIKSEETKMATGALNEHTEHGGLGHDKNETRQWGESAKLHKTQWASVVTSTMTTCSSGHLNTTVDR